MRFADLVISFKQAQKQIANSMEQSKWEVVSRLASSEIPPPFMEAQILLTCLQCFVTGRSAEIICATVNRCPVSIPLFGLTL
jgi:hypothetical protein